MEHNSGWAFVTSPCYGCGQIICYNPHRVPSIRIEGVREPICRGCVAKANPKRIANGLDPIVIHDDAYDAIPEREL